jgi:hypothetical protein
MLVKGINVYLSVGIWKNQLEGIQRTNILVFLTLSSRLRYHKILITILSLLYLDVCPSQ